MLLRLSLHLLIRNKHFKMAIFTTLFVLVILSHICSGEICDESRLQEIETSLKNLQRKQTAQEELINQLMTENAHMTAYIREHIGGIENDILSLRNVSLQQLFDMSRDSLSTRGLCDVDEPVAFSVYLDKVIEHLGIHQPIRFDNVLTNEGQHYSPITGMFTTPHDGVYVFSFTIAGYYSSSPTQEIANLVVDNVIKVNGISDALIRGQDVQGGNLAILRLTAGQFVWLESANAEGRVWAQATDLFSSFSGFRLY